MVTISVGFDTTGFQFLTNDIRGHHFGPDLLVVNALRYFRRSGSDHCCSPSTNDALCGNLWWAWCATSAGAGIGFGSSVGFGSGIGVGVGVGVAVSAKVAALILNAAVSRTIFASFNVAILIYPGLPAQCEPA